MLKKVLLLAGLFILFSACVITSPAEIFFPTPTICVECVQATICAENAPGDACVVEIPPTPVDVLPTLFPATSEPVATRVAADNPLLTKTLEVTNTPMVAFTLPAATVKPTIQKPSKTPLTVKTDGPTPFPSKTRLVSITPSLTPTATPATWIYVPQTGSPKYTKNFAHPESACKWAGIAGQVFGPGGAPQTDVVAVVTGDSNGTPIDLLGLTGASVAYGTGAFEAEFPVGPVRTYETIKIQLFDIEGNELSAPFPFDTYSDCTKNLVVFNFVLAD
jgi:hypothetical protein